MGTIVYSIMICLGEMVSHLPLPGGHITMAARFVDPGLSFAMGWNYAYNWIIVLPAELSGKSRCLPLPGKTFLIFSLNTAAAVLISYWDKSTSAGVYIAEKVVTVGINMFGTRVYGEMEFYFAAIKVITIVGLIASFSYIGTEITAIAAGEAKNPRRNLPKVIKRVWIRICLFYIGGVFVIGLLVPSNDSRLELGSGTAASSPFVIAISNAGIKALPSIVNAALLTSAWSAGSSDMYTSSRALYGLALNGNAPKALKKVNSWGLPWVCVAVSAAFGLLSFMAAGAAEAGTVFNWFANMTSVCGLITWAGIAYTYIRFYNGCKAQGIDRSEFPYRAPFQPYAAYYALIFICVILFFNSWEVFATGQWDTATFVTAYLPIFVFPILYLGSRFYFKAGHVPLAAMDFYTGSRDIVEEDEIPPRNFVEKLWQFLM
ncbi:hypothetical protein RQP46_007098 [Phenoliferia psychrophenolica]